jgi:hypothetical protein
MRKLAPEFGVGLAAERAEDRLHRVSTIDRDLTAQRGALAALGVDPKRIYVDHGLTGTKMTQVARIVTN